MKSHVKTLFQLLFITVFIGIFGVLQNQYNDWNYLVFAQTWPKASCIDINMSPEHTCLLDKRITTWTIHGLWPNRNDGQHPSFCNNSYPFREAEIADIEDQLMLFWPNLIKESKKTDFWKHEWIKHGTCGMTLQTIDTEHKYFAKSLDLNKQFNLKEYLENSNIVPSQSTYQLADVRSAIEQGTSSKVILKCLRSKDRKEQAIIQVETCLKKDFTTMDCPDTSSVRRLLFTPSWDYVPYYPEYESCDESLPVQYLPFNN